jgi:hypothetical protein
MVESHQAQPPTGRPPVRTDMRRRDVLQPQVAWLEEEQPAYLVAALGRPG